MNIEQKQLALILGCTSFVITFFLVPIIINKRFGFKEAKTKNSDLISSKKKLNFGGVAIAIGMWVPLILCNLINPLFINSFISILPIFFICSILIFFLGLIDDIKPISPFIRLFFQFIISSLFWKFGLRIVELDFQKLFISLPNLELNKFTSLLFTSFWINAVLNAFNWIDGLDNLLINISSVSLFTIIISSIILNNYFSLLISICLLGACLGFLKYNRYPSKIIMGDNGSNFIGFIVAILTIFVSSNNENIYAENLYDLKINLPLAYLIIFVPLTDMIRVILVRISKFKSPFLKDFSHFHYLLLNDGISVKNINLLITIFTALICYLAIKYFLI